MVIEMTSVQE